MPKGVPFGGIMEASSSKYKRQKHLEKRHRTPTDTYEGKFGKGLVLWGWFHLVKPLEVVSGEEEKYKVKRDYF